MSPKAYLNTLAVLLCLLFVGAGGYGVWSYRHMAEQNVRLEAQAEDLTALQTQVSTLNEEALKRASQDNAIRTDRETVNKSVETVANEDPDVGAYLRQRIPDGLRNAHREARGARAVPSADRN